MATMTNEQIEQKKQQLKQLAEEVKAITQKLAEAGAIELSEDDLDKAAGGVDVVDFKAPREPILQEPSRQFYKDNKVYLE